MGPTGAFGGLYVTINTEDFKCEKLRVKPTRDPGRQWRSPSVDFLLWG